MHIRAHVKPTAEPEKYCGCAGPEVELAGRGRTGRGHPGRPADWGEAASPCGLGAGSGRWLGRKKMQLDTLVDTLTKIANSSWCPALCSWTEIM